MGWYDVFALTYDRQLEALYRPHRSALVETLAPERGARVLDVCCGTGQSFDALRAAVGDAGTIIGVDRSKGMLKRAQRRIARNEWSNVSVVRCDARALADDPTVRDAAPFDAVVCALGLSAIAEHEAVFEQAFGLLRSGGRFAILDVHAALRTRQTRMVELVARADLSREVWRALEAASEGFSHVVLEDADPRTFGGELYVACGHRP
ncbi:MAG: methyltransferase domain-containing protein [Myxococcales bacterium]|nr:methyltransferase domain-containing protein [Myxococcales bacterium]